LPPSDAGEIEKGFLDPGFGGTRESVDDAPFLLAQAVFLVEFSPRQGLAALFCPGIFATAKEGGTAILLKKQMQDTSQRQYHAYGIACFLAKCGRF
jgi:hypothetical protein